MGNFKNEVLAEFVSINADTNNIAQDIDTLTKKLEDGVTKEEQAEILSTLRGHSATLKTIASKTPDGEVTPPPAEEETGGEEGEEPTS